MRDIGGGVVEVLQGPGEMEQSADPSVFAPFVEWNSIADVGVRFQKGATFGCAYHIYCVVKGGKARNQRRSENGVAEEGGLDY
jgi:hypothetical protein